MKVLKFKKVLFLNLPFKKGFSRSSRFPSVTRSGTLYYPIWLSYAAAYIEKFGVEIKLIDAIAENIHINNIADIIKNFKPDIIVTEITDTSLKSDIHNIGLLKKEFSSSLYVIGGTYATALPQKSLQLINAADIILIGEYEKTLLEICQGQEYDKINGIAFKKKDMIIVNAQRNVIKDLNSIPFVSKIYKQHLKIKKYSYGITQKPVITILSSRGCPYKCSFCLWPQTITKGAVRSRSPNNIADEFIFIKKEMPYIKEIFIEDDTFNYSKQRVIDICNELIKAGNKIKWSCNVRIDLSYEEMILMKKAGCRLLVAGFESGSQKILNSINKQIDINQSYLFMKNAKKAKLLVHGCFILGLPYDTKKTIEDTINLSIKLNPDTAQFDPLFIMQGTEVYLQKNKLNIPKINDNLLKYARKKFYLRVGYILNIVFLILKSPIGEGKRIIRVFFKFIKWLF